MDNTEEVHKKVKELHKKLRTSAADSDDPEWIALCETSGEVLGGLEEAFDNFLKKRERVQVKKSKQRRIKNK